MALGVDIIYAGAIGMFIHFNAFDRTGSQKVIYHHQNKVLMKFYWVLSKDTTILENTQ